MNKSVIELFAGVGGFRVGLNDVAQINGDGRAIEKNNFNFVWFNQWEPSTKKQYAYECYVKRFGDCFNQSNQDISLVDKSTIPDHSLLVGGFPCQDYSVAHSLSKEKGIEGKKGVLWWQIDDILAKKNTPFVLLENVDRLLRSPAKQRGRDFAIMLRCFNEKGYIVEWRVINAADYGFPQRRRRVFIFAAKKNTKYCKDILEASPSDIIHKRGIFAKTFPIEESEAEPKRLSIEQGYKDLVSVSNNFQGEFLKSGILIDGIVYTEKTKPIICEIYPLKKIVENDVDNSFFLTQRKIQEFKYLRGKKKVPRKKPNGDNYFYSEGSMSPLDDLNLPGRTMLTSEGTTNRSTHVIKDPKTGKPRILTPIECERLNQFPDNWTDIMPERKRYFVMGNALVCGIVRALGKHIAEIIEEED